MRIYKPTVDRIGQDGTRVLGDELIFEGNRVHIHSDAGEFLNVVDQDGEIIFWRMTAELMPPELTLVKGGKEDE
jgi:hypothetical protein